MQGFDVRAAAEELMKRTDTPWFVEMSKTEEGRSAIQALITDVEVTVEECRQNMEMYQKILARLRELTQ